MNENHPKTKEYNTDELLALLREKDSKVADLDPSLASSKVAEPAVEDESIKASEDWIDIGELKLPQENGDVIVISPGQEFEYCKIDKEKGDREWDKTKIVSIRNDLKDQYEIKFADDDAFYQHRVDGWAKFFSQDNIMLN